MYENVEIINRIEHATISVKAINTYDYAKNMISAPITITEFYESCKDYPIVFSKEFSTGEWMASIILGFKENNNLFINEEGIWEKNRYIPASIRRYPFILIKEDNDNLAIAIESQYKSEDEKDEERKLFNIDGENTSYLDGVIEFLTQFQNDVNITREFIKQMEDLELLEEKTLTITKDSEQYNLNGFYIINEEKLNHLSKKKKDILYDKNLVPFITVHLISLSNINKLINL